MVKVFVVLALAIGLWLLARHLDPTKLVAAFSSARLAPLLIAIPLAFGSALLKSAYWTLALSPRAHLGLWPSFRLTLASVVASLIAPRGGDFLKIWQLKQRFGIPASYTLAVNGLEKVGDLLSLSLIVAPLPWMLPLLPQPAHEALLLLPMGVMLLVIALLVAARHPKWARLRWLSGLSLLRAPKILAWGFLSILGAWFADLAVIRLVLYAVGTPVGMGVAMLMLLFVNLAIAVPTSPGNAGAQEVGAVLALKAVGVSNEVAVAAALLLRTAQTIPLTLAGLVEARTLLKGHPRA